MIHIDDHQLRKSTGFRIQVFLRGWGRRKTGSLYFVLIAWGCSMLLLLIASAGIYAFEENNIP
ncbi:hypothetical protein DN068_19070 [Taibaiella soli]|uniref:Uncharacterized protein n=1 Tax=Taibaiella soli TaxID=1649169 RepID=A0A2W2ACP6_9BACT|nr:hypothetical protein DN068_19070 [Taibaiella soli]